MKCFVLNAIPLSTCLKDTSCKQSTKINEIVNKFLLVGDKFTPEMHLKQPDSTYSACGIFIKNKKRIETFMQTGNTDFIYRKELDKA